jgi:glucose/arabinose dehydrogenase
MYERGQNSSAINRPLRRKVFFAASCLALLFASSPVLAGSGGGAVGQHFELHLSDLPAPYHSPSSQIEAEDVARADDWMPNVPSGFHVGIFASGLDRPREIAVAPNGTVFVSQTHLGQVVALRDDNEDGVAEVRRTFLTGFREPTGLAVQDGALYVADRRAVWRVDIGDDMLSPGARSMVTRPGALGQGGGHITREIVFAPDGKHFYVSIGSETDTGEDAWPRATIQQFRSDGQAQTTYAGGLRNPVGLAFYPGTDDLYAVVNEREGLGAGLVPDFLTRIEPGAFYGFPYAYLGDHPDPQFGDLRPDLVKETKAPDLLFKPRSVPLGFIFYQGDGFPDEFRGDAIVALHGPRNAGGAGISLVRVKFRGGRPRGGYETFMTGFGADMPRAQAGGDQAAAMRIWGRPVWIAEAADGSLLVSDDVANVIWRVSWAGSEAGNATKPALPAQRR